jgi:uncharacterized membrane protein
MNPIQEYFINPILQNGWFNPLNTIIYGLILVVAVWAVYKLIIRLKIQIDFKFALALLPFIFWGATTRVLHDAAFAGILSPELEAIYSLPIFPTPGSYILTFALTLAVLLASLLVQRFVKLQYWKVMLVAGLVLDIINIALLPFTNFFPFLPILALTALWTAIFLSYSSWQSALLSRVNAGLLSVHMFDAAATVTAVVLFGYLEQHVLPRLLFSLAGPYSFFLLKFAIIWPILWLIDRYTEPGNFRNLIKIVILILGLAPGLRDTIRLVVGV